MQTESNAIEVKGSRTCQELGVAPLRDATPNYSLLSDRNAGMQRQELFVCDRCFVKSQYSFNSDIGRK